MVSIRSGRIAATLLLLSLVSCSEALAPSDGELEAIDLDPTALALEVGDALQVRATLRGVDGSTLTGRQVFWAAEDTTVARVSASGMVTAVGQGSTRIAASAEGRSALAQVEIRVPAVASISILPASATLTVGSTLTLGATLRDARNRELSGRPVVWRSSDDRVATVENGIVRALRAGNVTITASSEGAVGSASINIRGGGPARLELAQGNGQTGIVAEQLAGALAVRVVNDTGDPVSGVTVSWAVEAGGGSLQPATSVTAADGIASTRWTLGTRAGEQRASASLVGSPIAFSAQAQPGPLQVIRIEPDSVSFAALGATAGLRVSGTDAHGNAVPVGSLSWSTTNNAVATVSGGGVAEARGHGAARLVARAGSAEGSVPVRVQQRAATVNVSPSNPTLTTVGSTVRLAAAVLDANGQPVAGATVGWTSDNAGIATVDGSGLVTARGSGQVTIRASSGGVEGNARVQVVLPPLPPTVATVNVTPSTSTLTSVGSTVRLAAAVLDQNGQPVPGAVVAWTSDNTGVATVDESGLVTARGAGQANIRATSQGVSGSARVNVVLPPLPPTVARVEVTPASVTLGRGGSCQLTARAFDAAGNVLSGRSFTWTTSDASSAQVSGSGLVSHVSPGNAVITATTGGVSGTATVSVNNGGSTQC